MGRAVRLLFVGNSLTFFNNLPGTIQRLVAATDAAVPLVDSVVRGGATLLGHLRAGEAVARLRRGDSDWVVLQEQSTRPIDSPALFGMAARALDREVRAAGGRTLLYLTWARRGRPADQAPLDAEETIAHKTPGFRGSTPQPRLAWLLRLPRVHEPAPPHHHAPRSVRRPAMHSRDARARQGHSGSPRGRRKP